MEPPHISNEVVRARTGKTWGEWFVILDQAGAKKINHKEIVAILREQYQVDDWWQQTITVEYEQARGLRMKHQKTYGFQISKSITITTDIQNAYNAWSDKKILAKWLADTDFTLRKATKQKSLRITWIDNETHLDVYFYPKGDRSQVTINHGKIKTRNQAEEMKIYWGEQLKKLKVLLEKN